MNDDEVDFDANNVEVFPGVIFGNYNGAGQPQLLMTESLTTMVISDGDSDDKAKN